MYAQSCRSSASQALPAQTSLCLQVHLTESWYKLVALVTARDMLLQYALPPTVTLTAPWVSL